MKKAFRLKHLELGKTRTKKASPGIFNFYVVLARRDTAGLPRAGEISKPHLQKKYKKRRTFRKHGFQRNNYLNLSDKKKRSSLDQTTPWSTQPLNTTIEYGFGKHSQIN